MMVASVSHSASWFSLTKCNSGKQTLHKTHIISLLRRIIHCVPFSDLFKGVFQKIYIASETPKHINVISSSPSTLPPASAQRLCCSMEGKSNDNKHPQLINMGIFPFLHDMITAWDGVPVGFVVKQNVKCLNHTTQMMLKINLFRSAFFIGHFLHTHSLDGLLYPPHTQTHNRVAGNMVATA